MQEKRVVELQTKLTDLEHIKTELKKIELVTDSSNLADSASHIFGTLNLVVEQSKLVSCSFDKSIRIWNLERNECTKTLHGHTDGVKFVESLPGNRIVSASFDKLLKIWDLKTGQCVQTLAGHEHPIYCLKLLTGCGSYMATGSYETIKVWDV